MSGLEFNSSVLPGVLGVDYIAPSNAELEYFKGKGVDLIRLPVLWERLQPGLLAGQPALNSAYLDQISGAIARAALRGMKVVVDVHNYGQYLGNKIGGGVLNDAQFADFWQRIATALRGKIGLAGYDLMNEPNAMPTPLAWPHAAQAAVSAIRKVDGATWIYVEGDDWASAGSWPQDNPNLSIDDPSKKTIFEAHVYGDRDNSGTHFVWSQEVKYGVTVDTIAQRIAPFAQWCAQYAVPCMIGETGVGDDSPEWNTELANGLAKASGKRNEIVYLLGRRSVVGWVSDEHRAERWAGPAANGCGGAIRELIGRQGRCSFLKKRTKRLLPVLSRISPAAPAKHG